MKLIPVPPQRSSFKTFQFYFFRYGGPAFLILGALGAATLIWLATIPKLTLVFPLWFLCLLFAVSIVPLGFYIYSALYTVLGDVGETAIALRQKSNQSYLTEAFLSSLPVCAKCGLPKPPRCHHCSICNKCHMRMDHHCPAIGTCIALRNTQPFIVMLRWAKLTIAVFFSLACLASFFVKESRITTCVIAAALIIMYFFLASFLSDFMVKVENNTTTLETIHPTSESYNLGKQENIDQVFGKSKYRNWIPQKCTLTGFEWCSPDFKCVDAIDQQRKLSQPFPTV